MNEASHTRVLSLMIRPQDKMGGTHQLNQRDLASWVTSLHFWTRRIRLPWEKKRTNNRIERSWLGWYPLSNTGETQRRKTKTLRFYSVIGNQKRFRSTGNWLKAGIPAFIGLATNTWPSQWARRVANRWSTSKRAWLHSRRWAPSISEFKLFTSLVLLFLRP